MILKNLMEEKQLNFEQPLLSVRRGSSTIAPPDVNKRKTYNHCPSLPPLPYYKSELKSGPVTNPGAVPFQWEKMPGRPKDENKAQKHTLEHVPLAPKLPPGRIGDHKQKQMHKVLKGSPAFSLRSQAENSVTYSLEISSPDKDLSEVEGSEKEKEDEDSSSSEDENVTYLDARDTLSRTESFFNCSVSGVSGLDGSNIESSRASSDHQTRDFMMGRFLPAAKAVASETSPFASRKNPVMNEQPKAGTKVVKWNKKSSKYCIPDTLHRNINGEGEDKEEDEKDECDGIEDLSDKLCGLLPKFYLLNPIPGMRDHAQVVSSVRSVRRRPAYGRACWKSENKERTNNHRERRKITRQYASTDESSMNTNSGRNNMTKHINASPHLFLDRYTGFLGLPKEPRDFGAGKLDLHKNGRSKYKELSAHLDTTEMTSPLNPAIEKTLYIDSERMVESRTSNSSSSESTGKNPSVDYSLQDIQPLCGANEKAISAESKSSDIADSGAVSSSIKPFQDFREDMMKDLQKDQAVNSVIEVEQPPKIDVKKGTKESNPPLALGPLLPKSPSESWLSRTLPSMSSRNPSSKSYPFWPSPVDPKRDRMLRSPNVQHLLVRPVGELAPILEN